MAKAGQPVLPDRDESREPEQDRKGRENKRAAECRKRRLDLEEVRTAPR